MMRKIAYQATLNFYEYLLLNTNNNQNRINNNKSCFFNNNLDFPSLSDVLSAREAYKFTNSG